MVINRTQEALLLRIMVCIFILFIFFWVSIGTEYFTEFFSQAISSFPLLMFFFKDSETMVNLIFQMKHGIIYFELSKIMLVVIFSDIFVGLMEKSANLISFAPLGVKQGEINKKFEKTILYVLSDNLLSAVSSILAVGYAYLISKMLEYGKDIYAGDSEQKQMLFCVLIFVFLFMAYVIYVSKKNSRSRINSFVYVIATEILTIVSTVALSSLLINIYESIYLSLPIAVLKCLCFFGIVWGVEYLKKIISNKHKDDKYLDYRIGNNMNCYSKKFKYSPKTFVIMIFLYIIMIEVINIFVMEGMTPDAEMIFIFSEIPFMNELMQGLPIANLLLENPSLFIINLSKLFLLAVLVSFITSKFRIPWIGDFIKFSDNRISIWSILFKIMLWMYAVVFTLGLPMLFFIVFMALAHIYPGIACFIIIIFMFAMFYMYYMIKGTKGFVLQSVCNTLLTLLLYGVLTCTPRLNQFVHVAPIILWSIAMVILILVGWIDKKSV